MGRHTEKLEIVDISKLIPYANNARTHSDEQIKKIQSSLREFGFINPVLIDKDCGIIAGHGRVEAAKREGMTEVPCVWVEHLTETQKRAYILADNKLAEYADWNQSFLTLEIEELLNVDFDINITGFTQNNINVDDYTEEFSLREGDRAPIQNMTFTFSDDEAEVIKEAISEMKHTDKYSDYQNPNNINSNGNALFLVVQEWIQQRT